MHVFNNIHATIIPEINDFKDSHNSYTYVQTGLVKHSHNSYTPTLIAQTLKFFERQNLKIHAATQTGLVKGNFIPILNLTLKRTN